jgi:uncharacterized repeat protein (TIGR01451 family)
MQSILKSQASGAEQANTNDSEGVPRQRRSHLIRLTAIELMLGIVLCLPSWYAASAQAGTYGFEVELQANANRLLVAEADMPGSGGGANPAGPFQLGQTTTLTVAILSSPWATLDHNDPGGSGGKDVPAVFVVEALIANSGDVTATDVIVDLDYSQGPGGSWNLLPGEDPQRTLDELAPGEVYVAYWLASYPATIGASYQYTVSADADNADPVATSDNWYENPEPGKTVKTRPTVGTGNSGVAGTSARVGATLAVSIRYDLGTNPQEAAFSPVGNTDFAPGDYRLFASQVRLYDRTETQVLSVDDRLYFESLPASARHAEVTYTFIVLNAATARVCPYTTIRYNAKAKYDQFYCRGDKGNTIVITGTPEFSMTKQASSQAIQQGQTLTYTIHYANRGIHPLADVWIWDDVDPDMGSILTSTIQPPSNPTQTTGSRVAWYLPNVPETGQPGSSGSLIFAILVNGNGQYLADGTSLVNQALFGINQNTVPRQALLSSTVTNTVQAPTVTVSKSDGRATVEAGNWLTYTLRITNSGSIPADRLLITDVLPADVAYNTGTANPPETSRVGQILFWDSLGLIPSNGGTVIVTIPASVRPQVQKGTVLSNTMQVQYKNPAGIIFDTMTATDTTTVSARTLTISKSDYPDPVLTGDLITYTVHVTNSGPAAATHVLVTDLVPMSTTYRTCSPQPCAVSDEIVSWTLGALPAGHRILTFSVRVSDSLEAGTLIRNQDYGVFSDQSAYYPGLPVTTLVNRNAAFFEGYAFQDDDLDGVRDGGEMGLAGITVTLASANVPLTTTNGSGAYYFRVESEGPISMAAAVPDGYFRTTHGTVFTHAVMGITQTVDFGYAPFTSPLGAIYGTVFGDLDCNGIQNGEEHGIPDVRLTMDRAIAATTDGYGGYTFSATVESIHNLVETDLDGYFSTTPNTVTLYVEEGHSYQVDFGDTTTATCFAAIYGTVFNDADTDEMWDYLTEVGIPNVVITLTKSRMVTTSPYGGYTLSPIQTAGTYTVTETDPDDYVSTTPNVVRRSVELGHGYPVNFGDVKSGPSPTDQDIYLPVILKNH